MLWTLLLVLLILLLIATFPVYPYSRGWGYYPTSALAVLLVVYLLLIWFGFATLWHPWTVTGLEPGPAAPAIEAPPAD